MPRRMSSSSFSRSLISRSSSSSNQAKPFRPAALGRIERDVALAERGFLVVAAGEAGKADRRGDLHLRALDEQRRRRGPARICCGDVFGACGIVDRRQQHGEFVAAGSRAASAVRRGLLRSVSATPQQHLVAGEVPVKVVDSLEMIEVEHEEHAART